MCISGMNRWELLILYGCVITITKKISYWLNNVIYTRLCKNNIILYIEFVNDCFIIWQIFTVRILFLIINWKNELYNVINYIKICRVDGAVIVIFLYSIAIYNIHTYLFIESVCVVSSRNKNDTYYSKFYFYSPIYM